MNEIIKAKANTTYTINVQGNLNIHVSFATLEDGRLEVAMLAEGENTLQDIVKAELHEKNTGCDVYVFADPDDEDATSRHPVFFMDAIQEAAEPVRPLVAVESGIIDKFDGAFYFLSNFSTSPVTVDGLSYLNAEAAFQAAKCASLDERKQFCAMSPSEAKRLGRKVQLRPNWDNLRNSVMYEVQKAKYEQNPELKSALLATGDVFLLEGNHWHDNYWGSCSCPRCSAIPGANNLGRILMKLRAEFLNE